jgi:hypothetical protein
MDLLTLPPPDQLRERIADCERELKALRRLLRASQDAYAAEAARRTRTGRRPNGEKGVAHGA